MYTVTKQYNKSTYHCMNLLVISYNKSSVHGKISFKISLKTLLISEQPVYYFLCVYS